MTRKNDIQEKAVGTMHSLGEPVGNGTAETRLQLPGPIFHAMIGFDGEKCRTASINSALLLCLAIDAGSGQNKNRTLPGTVRNYRSLSNMGSHSEQNKPN